MHSHIKDNIKLARHVTLVGMALDIVLGVAKIVIGMIAFSYALVADGIHSLTDAITDVFVLFITSISYHEPDEDHPYGHARFETLGTVLLGGMLIAIAFILAYESIVALMARETLISPSWPALVITIISILSKEWIFHYTRKAGEKIKSNLLIANAWHSRTDAFSSIVVLVGISGAMLGYPWLDAFAAVIVGIIIGKVGYDLVWDSLKELVDTGLDPEKVKAMTQLVMSVEGVQGVHDLRTRKMGTDVLLDLHIMVNPGISVTEGHQIGEWAEQKLLKAYSDIKDVVYHIDTEEDGPNDGVVTKNLPPLRGQVIEQLDQCWQCIPEYQALKKIVLHYHDSGVDIELFLSDKAIGADADLTEVKQRLQQTSQHITWLKDIQLWQGSQQD